MENNENNKVFTEKIIKTIEKYKDNTTSTIARIIENTAIENHPIM